MSSGANPQPYISSRSQNLRGSVRIPGDKSISHRAVMFGALAAGETIISGLLEGEDVLATAEAMRAMGADVQKCDDGLWRINGVGAKGLQQPDSVLQMGNSGTSTRLLMGIVAGYKMAAKFDGDASLVKRPMARVITPLAEMGAEFESSEGGRLPLTVYGSPALKAIRYELPVASAQVKSAIMLAGLRAAGVTEVVEFVPTRDHSEKMLRHFGVNVDVVAGADGAEIIRLEGGQELLGCAVDVPSDPSSAAFMAVAAAITPGSDIVMPAVGMNPRRNGVFTTLAEMGADITFANHQQQAGEPVCDIRVRYKALKGVDIPAARVASMIDEFPIVSMAAACAEGITRMVDLKELRVKESDRLAMIAKGLAACGVALDMGEDSLTVFGTGKPPKGGALIETALDHRIAMSFLVLGLVTDEPVTIDDGNPVKTSFPAFFEYMDDLGANIERAVG